MTVTGFLSIFLNLVLAEEIEDEAASITANEVDAADDAQEWRQIEHRKGKGLGDDEESGEKGYGGRDTATKT